MPWGERIPVLDGLRGIAILLVIVFHFWKAGAVTGTLVWWERAYSYAAGMGWTGVDLFFVLSGFLITGILYDSRHAPHYFRVFYARRTVRIFPVYYAYLTVFLLVIPFLLAHLHNSTFSDMRNSTGAKLFAWSYLLNWYEGFRGFNAVSYPLQHFWSLAVEEQFYLAWPFLVLKLARRRLMAVCFGMMALGFALRAVLYSIHLPYAAYTLTFCRVDSLAIGAMVALSARNPGDWKALVKWARFLALPSLCAIVVLRVLNPECREGPGASPNFYMGTFAISLVGVFFGACLVMAIGLRQGNPMHLILGSSFLRFFGKYSYCLYICHVPIIGSITKGGFNSGQLAVRLHSELLSVLALNGIAFAASIAVAFASWHLYEKQWLKLKDRPFFGARTNSPTQ